MLARYLMYSQVYFHPVRRIYDIHLTDFLRDWLPKGVFSTDLIGFLEMSDVEVTAALRTALRDQGGLRHHADRIMGRGHYRRLYTANPEDRMVNPEAGEAIFEALGEHFDPEHFRHDRYTQKGGAPDFPVLMDDRAPSSSLAVSAVLKHLPIISVDCVFVARSVEEEAESWLDDNRQEVIRSLEKESVDG